ncbi:hypothetical protein VKS41_008515 [Umbelopsis sp. WA50703]
MSYNNSYEKPPMTQTGEAAGYGQTGTGGTYGQSGAGTGYGDTGTGTGTYDNTGTGTYGNTGTGTYGNTGTGTYDNSGTGTFGNTGTGTGAYPDAAHTGGKENYNSSYNATAPNGGDTTGAGYGQYSDPSSQPPPNYMAAQSQRVRGWYTPQDQTLAWKRRLCTALCCCICLAMIIGFPAGFTSGHRNQGCECWSNNDCYSYYGAGVYCYSDCRCYRG